jgi:hypothetical protein
MEKFFESITNGDTGEVTIRPYTEEEIAAVMAARARENVPDQISARQARLLILSKNKTIESEKVIQNLGEKAKINWEYGTEFKSGDEVIVALSKLLNLTEDQFFEAAGKL